MDDDRLKHSLAVARKMVEIAKEKQLSEESQQELFVLGLNHDIGYEYGENVNHNIIGGNILKESNYKYWKEVYFHGNPDTSYKSLYLDILNMADMQVDKTGNNVSYEERLEDIKNRYGIDSREYLDSKKIIDNMKSEVI